MLKQQEQITEGMTVIDVNGNRVGNVEFIKFGDEDLQDPGVEVNEPSTAPDETPNFFDDIARAIVGGPDIPQEVRQNLLRLGYMKIGNTGLFKGNRYATLDAVDHVHDDHVHLSIDSDALIGG
ncbi:hypothetical protein G4Y79_07085 [Phototrophicus methaneseepsis]|uniref:PRC-barrel domain-containing protein n=1 Tax=Phototrophicus methaneseepsis TaxID=2710758 RepID=A0A7S8EBV5_9CHLR|nr:hypothetical protein [Phototrophicus methaneseepsis]QPC84130.1 hypothetical protein G4Y79_07085 [Phototrophicus methaneseepsis]